MPGFTYTKQIKTTSAVWVPEVHNGAAPDINDELLVSEATSPTDLKLLLDSLYQEDSTHSWKNFDRMAGLKDLLRWENRRRPTKVYFFYLKRGEEFELVGTGSIAKYLNSDFMDPGFCVLGRCYIMPKYRGLGFYRRILQFRLERCLADLGHSLKVVHIGSDDERIAHVIAQRPSSGQARFLHLGEEALAIAGRTKLVNAYILLLPEFARSLAHSLEGQGAPPGLAALHSRLTGDELGDVRAFGVEVRDTIAGENEKAWLSMRDCSAMNQLMAFCSAIPLVGFK